MLDDHELSEKDKKNYLQQLESTWWELWEYFANTPLKTVYERHSTLSDQMQDIDLVEMFSKMKSELHLDLVTLIEEQLCNERDTELCHRPCGSTKSVAEM